MRRVETGLETQTLRWLILGEISATAYARGVTPSMIGR
jgi:hypothetical protein